MKYTLAIAFFILVQSQTWAFHCEPVTVPLWQKVSEGFSWAKFDVAFTPYNKDSQKWADTLSRSVTVRVMKIDLSKNKLLFLSPEHEISCDPNKQRYIKNVITDSKAAVLGAVNASFFIMPKGKILGMAVDEKTIWSTDIASQTISSSGIFGLLNGDYFLEKKDSFLDQYGPIINQDEARKFDFAIQAYPRLIQDDVITVSDSVLNSRRSRTSIGVALDSDELLLVTIDARGETSKTGMTLYEYAHFVQNEKCGVSQKMALNLDGGGSTAFALPSENLYEQVDRCRHLGNILTVQKRD